jgi:ParB-like chromosome segregation protein Spo0J
MGNTATKEKEAADAADAGNPATAAEWLRHLSARAALPTSPVGKRPDKLTVKALKRCPKLFQPRGWEDEDEAHVQGLVRALQRSSRKMLDPILVMPIGRDLYVIDGHHRVAAYEVAKVTAPVPVRYFDGTVREAVLVAGRRNSKDKLPMTPQERHNCAWKWVKLHLGSKAEIAEAAGVSERQVAYMHQTQRALGKGADQCVTWADARRLADGAGHDWSEAEREEWRERRVEQLIERIRKATGPKLTRADTETIAAVLEALLGRRLGAVVRTLGYVSRDRTDWDDGGDF